MNILCTLLGHNFPRSGYRNHVTFGSHCYRCDYQAETYEDFLIRNGRAPRD